MLVTKFITWYVQRPSKPTIYKQEHWQFLTKKSIQPHLWLSSGHDIYLRYSTTWHSYVATCSLTGTRKEKVLFWRQKDLFTVSKLCICTVVSHRKEIGQTITSWDILCIYWCRIQTNGSKVAWSRQQRVTSSFNDNKCTRTTRLTQPAGASKLRQERTVAIEICSRLAIVATAASPPLMLPWHWARTCGWCNWACTVSMST